MDACKSYTPIDPEDLANPKAINLAFVTQPVSDVCRKIQRMDGFAVKNRSKLLDIALIDSKDLLIKKKGHVTVAALQSHQLLTLPINIMIKRGDLYKRINAPTAKMGHWKNECPW